MNILKMKHDCQNLVAWMAVSCCLCGSAQKAYAKPVAVSDSIIREMTWRLADLPKNDSYFETYHDLLNAYEEKGQHQIAAEGAQNMYKEAKKEQSDLGICASLSIMGDLYNVSQDDEGDHCFQECIAYAEKKDVVNVYLLHAYDQMIETEITDSAKVNSYYARWTAALKRYEQLVKNSWRPRYEYYSRSVEISLKQGRVDEAEHYLAKADSVRRSDDVLPDIYLHKQLIALVQGDGEKVVLFADSGAVLADRYNKPMISLRMQSLKLKTLLEMGNRNAEVFPLLTKIMIATDSLRSLKNESQLNELRTQYGLDKIEEDRKQVINHLLMISCVSLFLVVGLCIVIVYSYRLRRKNASLFKSIKEQDRLTEQLDVQPTSVIEEGRSASVQEEASFPPKRKMLAQQEIVARLKSFLQEEEALECISTLGDDDLASRLATNRTSLRDAVKTLTGKTLKEYIQEIQLTAARHKLETETNRTIEAVAMECGFSKRTFYRLFREKYNISPSQYKELARRS
jgi:AraC-like DNA-binding protein/tetratricopeptide (TPR) repeat protein